MIKQSARKILELVFAREIEQHQLVAANFLGLAEIRLAAGDIAGALDLLHRLVIAVGNPFENLDPAAALLEKTGHNAEAIEFLDQAGKVRSVGCLLPLASGQGQARRGTDTSAAQESLAAIAAAATSYTLRISAAAAIAGRPHPDLGSGELNLLAGNASEITPAASDEFYFYTARMRAAQNAADAKVKFQLLSHCVIDFPRRDDPRVPLFEAATAMNSDEYALAIMEPLLQTRSLRNPVAESGGEEERIISSSDDNSSTDEESDEQSGDSTNLVAKLSRAQQAQVAQMIGDTLTRLKRIGDAIPYYDSARHLESSPVARKALRRKIADARATIRIQHQNAARQPLLHEPLEQDRVVRPRLLARNAAASKAAAQGGVKP